MPFPWVHFKAGEIWSNHFYFCIFLALGSNNCQTLTHSVTNGWRPWLQRVCVFNSLLHYYWDSVTYSILPMHLVGLKMAQVLLETFEHIIRAELCTNNDIWNQIFKDSHQIWISWWPVFSRPHFNPKGVVWNENEKNCLILSDTFPLRIFFNQAVPDLLFSQHCLFYPYQRTSLMHFSGL